MPIQKNQEFLRKIDIFSTPISLTLNQSKKIKTPTGGVLSLMVLACVLVGVVDQVMVILKANFTESKTTLSFANAGTSSYDVTDDQMLIAMRVKSFATDTVNDTNIANYYSIIFVQEEWNATTQERQHHTFPSKPCVDLDLTASSDLYKEVISEIDPSWYCVDWGDVEDKYLHLQGFAGVNSSFSHKQFFSVVGTCDTLKHITNSTTCVSEEDSLTWSAFMQSEAVSFQTMPDATAYLKGENTSYPVNRDFTSSGMLNNLTVVRSVQIQVYNTEYFLGWFFSSLTTDYVDYVTNIASYVQLYNIGGIDQKTGFDFASSIIYQFTLADTYVSQKYTRFTVIQQLSVFGGLIFSLTGVAGGLNSTIAKYAVDTHLMRKLYSVNVKGLKYFEKKSTKDAHFPSGVSSFYDLMNGRTSVDFKVKTILGGLAVKMVNCLCCKRKPSGAETVYNKARRRLYYEIDLVQILRQLRIANLLYQMNLKQYQIDLVPFFSRYSVCPKQTFFDDMRDRPGQYVMTDAQRNQLMSLSNMNDQNDSASQSQSELEEGRMHWFSEMLDEIDRKKLSEQLQDEFSPKTNLADLTVVQEILGHEYAPECLDQIHKDLCERPIPIQDSQGQEPLVVGNVVQSTSSIGGNQIMQPSGNQVMNSQSSFKGMEIAQPYDQTAQNQYEKTMDNPSAMSINAEIVQPYEELPGESPNIQAYDVDAPQAYQELQEDQNSSLTQKVNDNTSTVYPEQEPLIQPDQDQE